MSEYIRREDAVKTSLEFTVEYLGGAFDEGLQKELKNNLESLEPADVVSKADLKTLLEQTEKELVKDTDKYSIAYNFIVSVMGIIKCKTMQMGEKDDQ